MNPHMRYLILSILRKTVAEHETAYKRDFEAEMKPGDRSSQYVTVDGEEVELGGVTRSKPSPAWKVTDEAKFTRWVEEHDPDAIMWVPVVSEQYTAQVLSQAKADGAAVTPEGEEIPGIQKTTPTSYVAAKPVKDAGAVLSRMVAEGQLSWADVLEVEA